MNETEIFNILRHEYANAKSEGGWTPLHVAACKGHIEILWELLKGRANPDAKDGMGRTPLFWAACKGHIEIEKVLRAALVKEYNEHE